ncbi:hypothetical protein DEU56DRAFT_945797 [Suillus clintonianus]|uniref:uncharacterized protein n=1 Tax=Suillus clintonianus TaxID=1904413 RepID=UPI001B863CD6|nr:uncharacterized protein DEU56DRAFT_945797 [Suillus clintonianus]KAG2138006.1 hypothetical protein DEU56DRAFT_945797 [Suillus clintonianus]
MVAARKLIKAGCEQRPKSDYVCLEAARPYNNDDAKVIIANAVQHGRRNVSCIKALENIPNSVRLWNETVKLEESITDARILLSLAVEVIPLSVELWLTLACLETPDHAKAVLNKARKSVPTSHEIWIVAGRLLEQGATGDPDKSTETRSKEFELHWVLLTRKQWLKEAERCESDSSLRTCEAIIKATVSMEVEVEDRLNTRVSDAESTVARDMIGTARAMLVYALKVFPDQRNLWRKAADVEKAHGTKEPLDGVLSQAVQYCPQAEVLWLMSAKEKWLAGNVPVVHEVLERGFHRQSRKRANLARRYQARGCEWQTGVATELLIWMKSAVFERQQGQYAAALETVSAALSKFPESAKLYTIQGQIGQMQRNYSIARASYMAGLRVCPKEITLWVLASKLEMARTCVDCHGMHLRCLNVGKSTKELLAMVADAFQ